MKSTKPRCANIYTWVLFILHYMLVFRGSVGLGADFLESR
jgi:hypothetical protein